MINDYQFYSTIILLYYMSVNKNPKRQYITLFY